MEELKKIIKSLKGSLIGIGINDEELIKVIEKNKNINTCYLLESNVKNNGKFSFKGRSKKVKIKKLKKYFTKKGTDTIICNYECIKKYTRSFIPNSIYMNKGKLYIYGNMNAEEIENIKKKYSRYTNDIEIRNNIIIINNISTKNNFIKDKVYSILDILETAIDAVTNILIN